eukprot:14646304-Ditylum_brightwellii.AAC.1
MHRDYDPTTPIEKYIACIEPCMDIVTNGRTPFTLRQIFTIAYDTMCRTGLYKEKCPAWEDKLDNEKTWYGWNIYFTKVVCDHHQLRKAAGMNYQANSVYNSTIQQDTIDAITNLTSATADGRNVISNITSSNVTLAAQMKLQYV